MKGIITIAGYGTRFLPASKVVPKEMFPLVDMPLMQYHVESLLAAGIHDIIVVARVGCEVVQQYFSPSSDLERHLEQSGKLDMLDRVQRLSTLANFAFVRQSESLPYGNASPALAARPWLTPGEPFYYMFGDDIVLADVPVPVQLVDAFRRHQPTAVLATQYIPEEETHLYGCIELKPGSANQLARIVEKPPQGSAPSNMIQIGHFVLTPEVFDVLDESMLGQGGELWLADAIDRLAARSAVIAQSIEGEWMPAGDPLRFLKANIALSLKRDELRAGLDQYLRSLVL